jgi:hypothetical protein
VTFQHKLAVGKSTINPNKCDFKNDLSVVVLLLRVPSATEGGGASASVSAVTLMQCDIVGSVAWFVHECMERVYNSHTGGVKFNYVAML